MNEKYTWKDVIFSSDDPRISEAMGQKVYYADVSKVAVEHANCDKFCDTFHGCRNGFAPFRVGEEFSSFIIIKKEPKKKRVPFDLSKKEDREALKGRWITDAGTGHCDYMIVATNKDEVTILGRDVKGGFGLAFNAEELFYYFDFADGPDTGKTVGKEVEE